MKNAMQLKAIIKKMAKDKKISAQLVLQNYMLERLLERVSLSRFRNHFILKGGFLIAAMVGLDTRATMDMDATIKGYPVDEKTIRAMFEEICTIEIPDDITFTVRSIAEIREGDEYTGYRVALTADIPPMAVPLKLDITTGDKITPKEIEYSFKLLMGDRSISILAYNLETILAEKLETVVSRGDQNTRPRDYYDIYVLLKLRSQDITMADLVSAVAATCQKRGTTEVMKNYSNIMDQVSSSPVMNEQWRKYQAEFSYAADVAFQETCAAVQTVMGEVTSYQSET